MAKGFTITHNTLQPNLKKFPVKLEAALGTLMDFEADKAQDYMRVNAPWTDRTGNARGGLFATHKSKVGQHVIVLYHTMPYGIWLETRFSGRYAIIVPTLQTFGPKVMRDIKVLMQKMGSV